LRLPREVVLEHQRERLRVAVIDLASEQGSQATTVTDLIDRAAVSRRTFYELFENKEDCLLYAYDTHILQAEAQIMAAYRNPKLQSAEALRAAIVSLLDFAIAWPAAAQLCIAEIAAVGPKGIERHDRSKAAGEAAVAHALRRIRRRAPHPIVIRAVVAGIEQLIHSRVSDGREHLLTGIETDLLTWILTYDRSPRSARRWGQLTRTNRPNQRSTPLADETDSGTLDTAAAQERRIRAAVFAVTSTKGYQATTFRDIAAEASVSLTTFYKHFDTKQDAFLAAFGDCVEELEAATRDIVDPSGIKPEAVREAIATLVGYLASHPAVAQITLVEIYAAGKPGTQRVDSLLACHSSIPILDASQPLVQSPSICEMIIGGFAGVLHQYAAANQLSKLPELIPPLTYFVLAPFIGSERALRLATE
jgi:AcrR family transcriptional regulator